MRTRRPFRPRQSPLHKERTCRPSTSPSIHPSRARGPKRVWAASSTRRTYAPAKTLSGPASKTRLPRTSKPCWRPRRWPRSPTSPNPGRRTRPSARTPDASAFRPNRCTAGCARARPFTRSTASWTPTTLSRSKRVSPSALTIRPASVRTSFSVWARPGRCIRASARTTSRSKTCPCSQTGKARSEAPPATLPAP